MTAFNTLLLLLAGLCFSALADQQTTKDEGVDHARTLIDGVRNLSTNTDPADTPGYQDPATLPEYQYYNSQNVSGMQTDATIDLSTGTANEAANFAWDQSTVPKLQFNPSTDPILTNAETIGIDAINNPDQITTTTGDCAIAQVSNTEPRLEHCTAWMIPTQHTCDKIVNVDVTWTQESNCGDFGDTYSEVSQQIIISGGYTTNNYVHARAVCNHNLADGQSQIQVRTTNPIHVSFWATAVVDDYVLQNLWIEGNFSVNIYGGCDTAGQCSYLISTGYFSSSFYLNFEKPTQTSIATATETIDNQCASLEAQIQ